MLDPDRYDAVAEAFDRYSERTGFPITECLMEMTRVSRADRLLDVACGSGIVTRRAAALVGAEGLAVGIDLSPEQIRVAREHGRAAGCDWLEFRVMDAMTLDFPDSSFDVVLAQFPHLPDRGRCIGEMVRVLRPGGRFAICNGGGGAPTWPLENAPPPPAIPSGAVLDGLFRAGMERYLAIPPAGTAGNAPMGVSGPQERLRQELEAAGLAGIHLWSYAYTAPFAAAEEAFEWESIRTSAYRMGADPGSPQCEAFRQAYLSEARRRHEQYGVLGLTTGALFGVGGKLAG